MNAIKTIKYSDIRFDVSVKLIIVLSSEQTHVKKRKKRKAVKLSSTFG